MKLYLLIFHYRTRFWISFYISNIELNNINYYYTHFRLYRLCYSFFSSTNEMFSRPWYKFFYLNIIIEWYLFFTFFSWGSSGFRYIIGKNNFQFTIFIVVIFIIIIILIITVILLLLIIIFIIIIYIITILIWKISIVLPLTSLN